jgi:subtilisin family serine protease
MKRYFVWGLAATILLAVLLINCSDQSRINNPQGGQSPSLAPLLKGVPGPESVEGSYIVVMKESVLDVDHVVNELSQRLSFTAECRYKYAIKGFAGKLSPSQVDELRKNPDVAYIEQDQIAHTVTVQPNPPSWGLDRIDQRNLPLDAAYNYNQTGAGVDAYIIDTGIRISHNDFGGRAVVGYDAITPGGAAIDSNGHGTHVSGTVGGTTYGVAKGVHLIAVKVLNAAGSGSYSQVIAGVDWVTSNHTTNPAVANMSLGGPVSSALDNAVRNSIADGVTYCVAAGNSAVDASTQSPADVVEAITVGATGSNDAFAYFSNYGSVVDLSAPGINITSDWNTSNTATNTISGTSMASPHATGVSALYLEANPMATPAMVVTALTSNATAGVITGIPSGTPNRLLYSLVIAPPPGPPAAPGLNSPANGATGVAVPAVLSWNISTGASSYEVQVSIAPDFGTLFYDQTGITTTSASVPGLASNTLYYWRVNATNGYGTSGWSAVWHFTTAAPAPPPAPTLVSPANNATNVPRTATLSWNVSTGATSYRVEVSTNSNFSTTVYDHSGIATTSTVVSGLGSRTYYYWRVNASNSNGTSSWSAVRRFRTAR